MAGLGPSPRLLAQYFKVDESTLERRLKKYYGLTPTEFIAQRVAPMKMKLLAVSIDEAIQKRNPTLIIFLLKNYLDFSDRREIKQEIKQTDGQQTVKVVLPGQVQEQVKKLEEVASKTLTPQQKEKLA